MIDPLVVTNFERTDKELQTFWIFCICVAGKNSDVAATKLNNLFKVLRPNETPFEYLSANKNAIHNILVANKIGQYSRIEKAIIDSLALDLRTSSLEDLMNVFGVGSKTARFFLLHSRRNCDHIVLDVHILKYLREKYEMNVPEQTPPPARYNEIEKIAIHLFRAEFPNLSLAEIDLLIWAKMSNRFNK